MRMTPCRGKPHHSNKSLRRVARMVPAAFFSQRQRPKVFRHVALLECDIVPSEKTDKTTCNEQRMLMRHHAVRKNTTIQIAIYPSILSINLSIYRSILSIYLSRYLFIQISIYLSIYLSVYLYSYLFVYPSIYLSIHLSSYLSISSVYLSIYLSLSLSFSLCLSIYLPVYLPA